MIHFRGEAPMKVTANQLVTIADLAKSEDARVCDDHPNGMVGVYVGRFGHEHTRYRVARDGEILSIEYDPNDDGDWR